MGNASTGLGRAVVAEVALEGRLCLPHWAAVETRLETNPRVRLLGDLLARSGGGWAGLLVFAWRCCSGAWIPRKHPWWWDGLQPCPPHDHEKGGRAVHGLHAQHYGVSAVCSLFLSGEVHRSWDLPWCGLGEREFGDVALDPERGVRHHRLSAGQAAVQEPPSVHGNHVGTHCAPLPKPLGPWGIKIWAFRAPPWTRVNPEPAMAPVSTTSPSVSGLQVQTPLPQPSQGASTLLPELTLDPPSMWPSPRDSEVDARKPWGNPRHLLLAGEKKT